jgi:hypothetical protein
MLKRRLRYPSVLLLILCIGFAPAPAAAQQPVRLHDSSGVSRPLGIALPDAAKSERQRGWMTSAKFTADTDVTRAARAQSAQTAPGARSSRGATRIVLGVIVGATGGFFAGGYLGAAIEGDRCHCDDPGLKGALIGAPIGAVVGGILGGRYLF